MRRFPAEMFSGLPQIRLEAVRPNEKPINHEMGRQMTASGHSPVQAARARLVSVEFGAPVYLAELVAESCPDVQQ